MTISFNTIQTPIVLKQAQAEGTKNGIRSISDAPQNGLRPQNGIRLLPDAPQTSLKDMAGLIKDSNMIQASDCTDWGWFPPGDPRSW